MVCPRLWQARRATSNLLILLVTISATAEAYQFARLKELRVKNPVCEGRLNLSVSQEYFVEIANDLPGKEDYNKLIQLYQKKDWEELDEGIEHFRKVYESSPLVEAVAFLEVQSKLDRANGPDTLDAKDGERLLRQALLLYPKSTLAPVITASLADYWMKNGLSQKSLSLYESARREYPFHALSCLFQLGVAEQNYLLKDWGASQATINMIYQKCNNMRVKIGAQIREAEMKNAKTREKLYPIYEKLAQNSSPLINRFYPQVLYNLGEHKFERGNYPSSRFYFKEFLKYGANEVECYPNAMKRIADIALQSGDKIDEVIGLYLTVKEKMPQSEVGRFSYLHALLLGLKDVTEPERARRLRIFDETVEKITNPQTKELAYLEKGLAMLEIGEKSSFDYLLRLHERADIGLNKGDIAPFVRDHLLKVLEAEASEAADKRVRKESEKDKNIFEPIEGAYAVWLKGTKFEARTRDLYSRLLLRRFKENLEAGKLPLAIEKLNRWKSSELWPMKGPSKAERLTVGDELAKHLAMGYPDKSAEIAAKYAENEDVLKPFLDPEYPALWVATAALTKDQSKEKKALAQYRALNQKTGIVAPIRDAKTIGVLSLLIGKSMAAHQQNAVADRALASVKEDSLRTEALKERFELYQRTNNYNGAYDVALQLLKQLPEDQRKAQIQTLSTLLVKGKLWKKAKGLLSEVQKGGFAGKELAPYYYLSGRAAVETKDCGTAVKSYEMALSLEPEAEESSEAQYRLGSCLVKTKKSGQARSIWEELAKKNDPFWSPLAQNELKLLK